MGASCNIAGDGPSEWETFVSSGIVISTCQRQQILYGMYNEGGGDCFYYCILQLVNLFDFNIVTVTNLRFALWYFITKHQPSICQEVFEAFRDQQDKDSYDEFVNSILKPHQWACSRTIIITSLFLQRNIVVIANEPGKPGIFKTTTAFTDRLNIPNSVIVENEESDLYIYLHLHEMPLHSAQVHELNHFCALKERNRRSDKVVLPLSNNFAENVTIINNDVHNIEDLDSKKQKKHYSFLEIEKYRTEESPQQSEIRKKRDLASRLKKKKNESLEEKSIRLKKLSIYMANLRSAESPQQSKKRKLCDRISKNKKLRNESYEDKKIRLKQKKDYRNKQKELKKSYLFSNASISEDINIEKISNEIKNKILNLLQEKLGATYLDEGVCIVCDRITTRQTLTTKSWNSVRNDICCKRYDENNIDTDDSDYSCENDNDTMNTIFDAMKKSLIIPKNEKLSPGLISYYDCSENIIELQGLLLSRKGLTSASHHLCDQNEQYLNFCDECLTHLIKVAKSSSYNLPPSHAIANHFFIGELPDNLFNDATWVEHTMTAMVSNVASTRIVRGGPRRSIRSHVLVFGSIPGPPATLLPRLLDDDAHFRIILAGPFTHTQLDRLRQQHLVRKKVCTELLSFYKDNNIFYRNVKMDMNALKNMPTVNNPNDMFDQMNDIDIPAEVVDLMDIQQQRVNDRSTDSNATNTCETMVIERTVVFIDTEVNKAELASKGLKEPIFTVHSSNSFVNDNAIAQMFPHLFPYGRGHPNEVKRKIKLSSFQCIKHYLMLSSHRHAQDRHFTLLAFDRLSMEHAYTRVSVKAKQNPSIYRNFHKVEVKDLDIALQKVELRRRGREINLTNLTNADQATDESLRADALLKSVEISAINVWGSNQERKRCRREAFSMVLKFGQPSLFITLTPNTDNGITIAYYAGITGTKSLFDLEFKDMPSPDKLEQIAMKDYCASARLYDSIINTFLTTAIGWDPNSKCALIEGGLFGHVKAHYGMTETQGSATLHCHILLWLHGTPLTTLQYDAQSEEEKIAFNAKLHQYSESILTNTLPSRPDLVSCSKCNEKKSFIPLPVKSIYRQKRNYRKRRSDSKNESFREPCLAQCKNCDVEVSAQHLIRRSLIESRPIDWPDLSEHPSSELPVSMTPLTDIDLENRYQAELRSRVSLEEAKQYVNDREKKRFPIDSNNLKLNFKLQDYKIASKNPIQLYDEPSRSSLNVKYSIINEDDIFKYFSTMPPSLDDSRFNVEYRNYIISALAAVLQGHYWQHCQSCFKFSKRTNSENSCRYCYPKDRVTNTIVDKKGIILKRLLGHEYINSFNEILMQTFRCNHDIQILIGGVEMSEVIYYCTKYTTKPQQEVYCSVALALASYRRRLEREKAEAELKSLTNEEISRKRVTGLIHTMTNSIEIAGTLAALYILRQSSTYNSHNFSSIHLDSILKWLFPEKVVEKEIEIEESVDLVKSFSFQNKKNTRKNGNEESKSNDNTIINKKSDAFLNKTLTRHELYSVVRPIDDYIYRSEKFSTLSLYEFYCKVYRNNRRENEVISDQGFMKEHPLHLTHVLRLRKHEVVPIINGKKLKLLTSNSDEKERNENSLLSLVLYKPFRNEVIIA